MTFELEIQMGNAAMDSVDDVAQALQDLSQWMDGSGVRSEHPALPGQQGPIRDANGNTVGHWRFCA